MAYNFADPMVADLVRVSHVPKEFPSTPVEPENFTPLKLNLLCCRCLGTWPCPTITEYRAFLVESVKTVRELTADMVPADGFRSERR